MYYTKLISRTASLALLLFATHTSAQGSDDTNRNLTLRFFTTSQESSCDYGSSSQALSFTTNSIPIVSHCFDIADLFGGNATSGFVNQSRNLPSATNEPGIRWTLLDKDTYDSSANYSSVLYRQSISSPSNDNQKPGHSANVWSTIYPGTGCTEKDPNDNSTEGGLLPWYGFSCISEPGGKCGTTPYKIASFRITPGDLEGQDKQEKCWDFARYGDSARVSASAFVALVISSLAVLITS